MTNSNTLAKSDTATTSNPRINSDIQSTSNTDSNQITQSRPSAFSSGLVAIFGLLSTFASMTLGAKMESVFITGVSSWHVPEDRSGPSPGSKITPAEETTLVLLFFFFVAFFATVILEAIVRGVLRDISKQYPKVGDAQEPAAEAPAKISIPAGEKGSETATFQAKDSERHDKVRRLHQEYRLREDNEALQREVQAQGHEIEKRIGAIREGLAKGYSASAGGAQHDGDEMSSTTAEHEPLTPEASIEVLRKTAQKYRNFAPWFSKSD